MTRQDKSNTYLIYLYLKDLKQFTSKHGQCFKTSCCSNNTMLRVSAIKSDHDNLQYLLF